MTPITMTEAGMQLRGKSRLTGFATMAGLRIFDAPEVLAAIPAIEAEAVAAERARIAEDVRGRKIPQADPDYLTRYGHGYNDAIAAVLALLDPIPR